jgi:hypothetical protein
MSQTETTTAQDHRPGETVTIKVNDNPVTLTDKHQTGASIKAAAIDQGVPIQPDFDLSEVLPNGKHKPISDDRKVVVKDGDEFWAIPGDDNS